ncbi:hypothetical protein ACFLZN_00530 [Nanoarchaeota archaeon]
MKSCAKTVLPNGEATIINRSRWLGERTHESSLDRAVLCLTHLIRNNFPDKEPLRVVEVGPIDPMFPERHTAPISLLSERHPNLSCVGFGIHQVTDEIRASTLGRVPYIMGVLRLGELGDESADKLIEFLGGTPNIIYGQHVFESSPGGSISLPFGTVNPFQRAAEILAVNGYLVVDNYPGRPGQVSRPVMYAPVDAVRRLRNTFSYMYSEKEGIYVFQKSPESEENT